MSDRKCAGCGEIKNRDDLIKITRQNPHGALVHPLTPKYLADRYIFAIIKRV